MYSKILAQVAMNIVSAGYYFAQFPKKKAKHSWITSPCQHINLSQSVFCVRMWMYRFKISLLTSFLRCEDPACRLSNWLSRMLIFVVDTLPMLQFTVITVMVFSDIYMIYHYLSDLSQRVDAVKDENLKLKSENQVQIKTFFFSVCGSRST